MKQIILYFLIFCSFMVSFAKKTDNFQLSPSDLKSLGVSEAEAQEFQQFINALNNMSPEEQDMIAKLGQELENQMRSNGLDPNNSDDVFKWIESQQAGGAPLTGKPTKPATILPDTKISKQEMKPTTSVIRSDISINDAKKLILEIIQKLTSARQKMAFLGADGGPKQKDVNELVFLLNVILTEDLLQHLMTQDFTKLYNNLEKLRSSLMAYEPLLSIDELAEIDEDDPYELLGIPYNATDDEIELAFDYLQSQKSPEAVTLILDQNNIQGKERKNILTDARLSFSFIRQAYEILKDPQERAIVDKLLKDKINKSKKNSQKINNAINKINNVIYTALTVDDISGEIKKLLKKYEPQQLEAAKRQGEREQKALERSKTTKAIAPSMRQLPSNESQYDAFWQSVSQEKHAKDYYRPSYGDSFRSAHAGGSAPTSHAPAAGADKGAKDGAKDAGKKEDKKEEKSKDGDKDGKGDSKDKGAKGDASKAESKKLDEKDRDDLLSNLISLEKLLENTKDEVEISDVSIKRKKEISDKFAPGDIKANLDNIDGEPKAEKVHISEILKNLDKYMTAQPTRSGPAQESFSHFKQFAKDNKIIEIKKELEALKKKLKSNIEDGNLKKRWTEKIFNKYGYRIEKIWGLQAGMALDPMMRNANNLPNLNAAKFDLHMNKKDQKNPLNISAEFEAMKDSAKLFREISTKFGIPANQQPKMPDKKK